MAAGIPLNFQGIPIWREWMGDEAMGTIVIDDALASSELHKAKSLFPEAAWCGTTTDAIRQFWK